MKVKAKDIAKALGISTATVSLALNNKRGVNEDTRRKVLEYAGIYNEGKTNTNLNVFENKTIKLICATNEKDTWNEGSNYLFNTTYECIFQKSRDAGYNLELEFIYKGTNYSNEILNAVNKEHVAGVCLSAYMIEREDVIPLNNLEIPIVAYDQNLIDVGVDSVIINNRNGVEKALNYLWDNGHTDIMYFSHSLEPYNMKERRKAWKEFFDEKELKNMDKSIMKMGETIEEVYKNVDKYIKSGAHMPTALFLENFQVAVGTIKALQDNRLRIGEDISVIGFDEIPPFLLLGIRLTYIKVYHEQKANLVISRLLERINGDEGPAIEILFGTELVIGNSVKKIYK